MIRVIIFDKDPAYVKMIEENISESDVYRVVGVFDDSYELVECLEESPAELVIFDYFGILYPQGEYILQKIRGKGIKTDIIVTTSKKESDVLQTALRYGAVDYLMKPYTAERLQTALAKYRMRRRILDTQKRVDQKTADLIISPPSNAVPPKGIQEKTACKIIDTLKENRGEWMSGDAVAKEAGLTGVTARKYLTYLADCGMVWGEMDYDTGGRPCMRYCIE